jgi:hypothetical protein
VVVVGGGPAGLMAATAAARCGNSVLLIERYGFLGGAGTAGGLSTFCGLHARTYGQDVRVIRGLADELLDRLSKLDGLNTPHLTIADGIAAQAFDISAYKIAADELVMGSGARILFHAMAVGAVADGSGRIDAVLIESKSGRAAVRGRFFIDASGDGDLASWAGVPWEKAPPADGMMYPSLMFRINGVDVGRAGPAPAPRRGGRSSGSWTTRRRPAPTRSRARSRSCARSATRSSDDQRIIARSVYWRTGCLRVCICKDVAKRAFHAFGRGWIARPIRWLAGGLRVRSAG